MWKNSPQKPLLATLTSQCFHYLGVNSIHSKSKKVCKFCPSVKINLRKKSVNLDAKNLAPKVHRSSKYWECCVWRGFLMGTYSVYMFLSNISKQYLNTITEKLQCKLSWQCKLDPSFLWSCSKLVVEFGTGKRSLEISLDILLEDFTL